MTTQRPAEIESGTTAMPTAIPNAARWTILAFLLGYAVMACLMLLQTHGLPFYESELHDIERSLNAVPGAQVVRIWGHEDVFLEEVTARVRLSGRGEIVLWGLSQDVFRYPDSVIIGDVNGMSFNVFQRDGIRQHLDIGRNGCFGHHFARFFNSPESVLQRFDEIVAFTDTLTRQPPTPYHGRCQDGSEVFVTVGKVRSKDVDPLFLLLDDGGDLVEAAKSLPWWNRRRPG